jgi:glyoxylase I family protein
MAGSNSEMLDVARIRVEERRIRRARNPFKSYFHHATRVADMEATRHFYEDIIGLPMTSCQVQKIDPETKQPTNFILTSFELADGNFVGFFQFDDPTRPYIKRKPSYLDHLAINVSDKRVLDEVFERVKANGVSHFFENQPMCRSLYIFDPDGDLFELAYQLEGLDDALDGRDAHQQLKEWLSEIRK